MCGLEEVYSKLMQGLQRQQFQEVERLCLFELGKRDKGDAKLLFYLGAAARGLSKIEAAEVAFNAALNLDPNNVDYMQACASTYEAKQDYLAAYEMMLRVNELSPQNPNVIANLGVSLERLGRYEESIEAYRTAISILPDQLVSNINLGPLLRKLGYKQEALQQNRFAFTKLPAVFSILFNLVDTLLINFHYDEALEYCLRGLEWRPRHAHLMMKKAIALGALSRNQEALVALSQARIINPDVIRDFLPWAKSLRNSLSIFLDGNIIEYEIRYQEQRSCFWQYRNNYLTKLRKDIATNLNQNKALEGSENAFAILSLDIDSQSRLALLRNISDGVCDMVWQYATGPLTHQRESRKKIRVAYISPNFRQHPNKMLVKQLFMEFDKENFEIYVYSLYNPDDSYSKMYREYLISMCDVYHDVASINPLALAELINHEQIDILVDLAGYTTHSRTEVLALRPAPIQMQYLGFQGSMGADFIDYAILDKNVCQDDSFDDWHESPIRLPHSLFPYDNEIDNSPTAYLRADFGLPENAIVFCCFNNSYKIEPNIFDSWMNILKSVSGSVLWLLGKSSDVQDNLEREAEARGVDKSRLVFAGRVPLDQHLPRYQLADLFLDTYWHNAHTTGAEALWQGLPLITIMGEVSSARGAASILTALEMPELIVQNHDEYEQLAIYYATHPEEYAAMREKLKAKRYTAPMYNTKLTVKHIEKAYQMAWERYQAGLPPAAFDVPENTDPELRKSIH